MSGRIYIHTHIHINMSNFIYMCVCLCINILTLDIYKMRLFITLSLTLGKLKFFCTYFYFHEHKLLVLFPHVLQGFKISQLGFSIQHSIHVWHLNKVLLIEARAGVNGVLVPLYYIPNDDFKTLRRFFSSFNCSSHLFIFGTRKKIIISWQFLSQFYFKHQDAI